MNPQTYPYNQYPPCAPTPAPAYQVPPAVPQGSAWKSGVAFALVLVPFVLFMAWGVLMEVRINKLTESQLTPEQVNQLRTKIEGLESKLAEAGAKLTSAATGLDRAASALEHLATADATRSEPTLPGAKDPKAGDPKRESPPK